MANSLRHDIITLQSKCDDFLETAVPSEMVDYALKEINEDFGEEVEASDADSEFRDITEKSEVYMEYVLPDFLSAYLGESPNTDEPTFVDFYITVGALEVKVYSCEYAEEFYVFCQDVINAVKKAKKVLTESEKGL